MKVAGDYRQKVWRSCALRVLRSADSLDSVDVTSAIQALKQQAGSGFAKIEQALATHDVDPDADQTPSGSASAAPESQASGYFLVLDGLRPTELTLYRDRARLHSFGNFALEHHMEQAVLELRPADLDESSQLKAALEGA